MKFETREDIEAPIDYAFSQISDFAVLERSLQRRGADVERTIDKTPPAPGIVWDTAFDLRGKRRHLRLEMICYEPPTLMRFAATSKSLDCDVEVELVSLSRGRTRMALAADLKPRTISARLMVQSLKLARTNVTKRFEIRTATFARDLEDRYLRRA
ncbi:SRPBCC family protein [Roseovarius sp. M141]|uniref:SRPBCC family protein n=1 Tax=Roseovarius sp. M141 TaxID=2583806 RepID=UPI0020CF8801|nr:SRPBCC family protein [Roseovarius sp. M141]MCQ0093797.1 SRPBCC family protein [Roseovarius sp. M141]